MNLRHIRIMKSGRNLTSKVYIRVFLCEETSEFSSHSDHAVFPLSIKKGLHPTRVKIFDPYLCGGTVKRVTKFVSFFIFFFFLILLIHKSLLLIQ